VQFGGKHRNLCGVLLMSSTDVHKQQNVSTLNTTGGIWHPEELRENFCGTTRFYFFVFHVFKTSPFQRFYSHDQHE
jgi:hypothetical protein